ncbi:hypothetical protein [Streptomyces sp. CNQ085]|uniref:hypothetical protein n=1 Tax=Streptomyces sp. CNQ085 TaxID=2886944 RepID=UPI001F509342|nr:hypothetical protein [Streptomyces sp. CNQ085]MCI0385148.1 hypothetical protein [Streptomyces sp. CNQ085]
MRKLTRRLSSGAAALAVAATLGLTTTGTAAAETTAAPGQISTQEQELLHSDTPKTVEIDPATGEILSVEAGDTRIRPMISNRNICYSTDGCYYSGRVPYANQGFYGTAGTYTGSWPYRSGYYTGKYTARACWTSACTQTSLPPNTTATFGGTLVTGTSFRIY